MSRGFVKSSKYSPGNMDRESLEKLFVGREKILSGVLKRLAASATGREKHFFLLVGPRGCGKTHFVALANSRIESLPAYGEARERLEIAYLNEEEWGIASYLDFLVRVLRALNVEQEDAPLTAGIQEIYALYAKDEAEARRQAERLLAERVGEKTLLLICENLVDLFEGLGEEGQKRWRTFIQERPFWTILATTPAVFAGVRMRESPFYGFFTVRYLGLLDFETAVELLSRKAEHEDKPELAEFLRTPTGRARARAIHHLAGGNHRAYVVLFDFLDKESLDDLVTPFMHMVDDLTPYYQDRMRQLAPRQRKLIEFLCHNRRPAIVKNIAAQCLMSPQTAAKQLGELTKMGFVTRHKTGRNTLYELSEPLMRICIEVKDNRTEHLRLFVEFLCHWFSNRELHARSDDLRAHDNGDHWFDRLHVTAALCELEKDQQEPFLEALDEEGKRCWDAEDYGGLAEIQRRLTTERGGLQDYLIYCYALRRFGDISTAIEVGRAAIEKYGASIELRIELVQSLYPAGEYLEALAVLDSGIQLAPTDSTLRCSRGRVLLRLERYEDVVRNETELLELDPDHEDSITCMARALIALEQPQQAELRLRELLARSPDVAEGWYLLAGTLQDQSRLLDALEALERLCHLAPDKAGPFVDKGRVLRNLNRTAESVEALERAITIDPDSVTAHCLLSTNLFNQGRYQEAVEACSEVLRLDPSHWEAYTNRACALRKLDRPSEAIESLRALLRADELEAGNLKIAASLFHTLECEKEAFELADLAVGLHPDMPEAHLELAKALIGLSKFEQATESVGRAEKLGLQDDQCHLVRCYAQVGTVGLAVGARVLTALLDGAVERISRKHTAGFIATMIEIEAKERGPVAMARQMSALRTELAGHMKRRILGNGLTTYLAQNVDGEDLSSDEWGIAVPILQSSLGDLAQCKIVLEMFDVAVRYASSGDESVLLELPLEQRELLSQSLGKDRGNHGS